MKTTTLPSRNSKNRSPLRLGFLLNALAPAVAWLALSELANAQCPQTCDLYADTALGNGALINNTTGTDDTATGAQVLNFNTTGIANTAHGAAALYNNETGSFNTATGMAAL